MTEEGGAHLRVMALHALAYCERLFYLEEVEEIRLADAAVFAGRSVQGAAELRLAAAAHRRAGREAEAVRREAEARRLADESDVERRARAAEK